jgi:hypothetical protein
MLRKSQFREEERRSDDGEREPEPDEEARDDELRDLVRAPLQGCAEECPGGAKGDGLAAAEAVEDGADKGEGDDGADGLDRV